MLLTNLFYFSAFGIKIRHLQENLNTHSDTIKKLEENHTILKSVSLKLDVHFHCQLHVFTFIFSLFVFRKCSNSSILRKSRRTFKSYSMKIENWSQMYVFSYVWLFFCLHFLSFECVFALSFRSNQI